MTRSTVLWAILIFAAAGAALRAADAMRIVPLVDHEMLIVSVDLPDAYTEDVKEAVSSGLRTSFTYDVDLRMKATVWFDRTVASEVVTTSDQYDNLTMRHSLSRTIDGRVDDSLVTEDAAIAKRWLTSLTRVPLCRTSKLDQSRDYYVRISARARPHGGSILGWANPITGLAKFTFVP
jgi:hypothetical protein